MTRHYPPGPRQIFPLSGLLSYRKGPLPFFQNLAAQFGDLSYFRLGPQEAFFLNHPDYIKEVLVTNHPSFHKGLALQRAKRLLLPASCSCFLLPASCSWLLSLW